MLTDTQKKQLLRKPGFKALMRKYQKGKRAEPGRRQGRGMKGAGMGDKEFWNKVWTGIKRTSGDVNTFLKKHKVISKGGKVVAALSPLATALGFPEIAVPLAAGATAVSKAAESVGYGRRKKGVVRRAPTMKGLGRGIKPTAFGAVSSGRAKLKF